MKNPDLKKAESSFKEEVKTGRYDSKRQALLKQVLGFDINDLKANWVFKPMRLK